MYTSAIDLKEFYDTTRGRMVRRIVGKHIRKIWPDVASCSLLGFGFATPYLRVFMNEAQRVTALMPDQQGPIYWPPEKEHEKNLVGLCEEGSWPIETNSIDRLLIVHGMQSYESLDAVLREAWRVLSGSGRLLLVVPNRTGIWAQLDNTPFGHGVPYSQGQIRKSLRDYFFVPEQADRALFVPPFSSRLMLATAVVWERMGMRFFNALGGVNIIEASKQLYAGTPMPATEGAAQLMRRRTSVVSMPRTFLKKEK